MAQVVSLLCVSGLVSLLLELLWQSTSVMICYASAVRIWNAHTSVGNITGFLVASALLKYRWGFSTTVPGLMIAIMGSIVFLFLPVSPQTVGTSNEEDDEVFSPKKEVEEISAQLLRSRKEVVAEQDEHESSVVGFMEAWRIPGVGPFALCLFFVKLVAYTFLCWLLFYISHTGTDAVKNLTFISIQSK